MKAASIFFLLLVWHSSFSQFVDSFDDGNHSMAPQWAGNTAEFQVLDNELALAAPASSGSSYLSTVSESINTASWQFSVRLEFNPSSSNYAEVYLVSDKEDLSVASNGYLVRIGWTSDDISLIRQDGEVKTVIIDGLDDRIDLSTVEVEIKVERNASGDWTLFSKLPADTDWLNEGTCNDITYHKTSYFGLKCNYTSTRSDKFFFDNFLVTGEPFVDNDVPEIDSVYSISDGRIEVKFNEELDSSSIASSSILLNDAYAPSQIAYHSGTLELHFNEGFEIFNTLHISGVRDIAGNEMLDQSHPFIHYSIELVNYSDIIINELHPDPTPPEDLPETEYIEIMNSSDKAIYMTRWSLSDKTTEVYLPDLSILPDSIIVFYPTSNNIVFEIGNAKALPKWPTLNNSGDEIILKDSSRRVIDKVEYTVDWYRDNNKAEGGWSLERIDPYLPCSAGFNWAASDAVEGGTPGVANSIFRITNDKEAPKLLSAFVLTADTLVANFSEPLKKLPILEIDNIPVLSSRFPEYDFAKIEAITTPLIARKKYMLTVSQIEDCSGNTSNREQFEIVLPEVATQNDLIISEILFNPSEEYHDYVELYNRSPKYIDLINWKISNGSSVKTISEHIIIEPNSYRAISSVPDEIIENYPYSIEETLVENELPALTNSNGSVVIFNADAALIDSVTYDEEWHFSYLNDFNGIALERINFNRSAQAGSNWASASSLDNYGTPGYKNSQMAELTSTSALSIEPKVIVPDANGRDDFVTITLEDNANSLATISIFNLNGQRVIQISNNELISGSSSFTWDGTDEYGGIVPLGHYIVIVDLIKENGETQTYREKMVVGTGY